MEQPKLCHDDGKALAIYWSQRAKQAREDADRFARLSQQWSEYAHSTDSYQRPILPPEPDALGLLLTARQARGMTNPDAKQELATNTEKRA